MTEVRGSPRKQNPAYRTCTYGTFSNRERSFFSGAVLSASAGFAARPPCVAIPRTRGVPIALRRLFRPPVFPALRSAAAVVAFFLTHCRAMANLREHIRQSSGYKWWILGMIMLGTFMAVLDVTVVLSLIHI